MSHLFVANWKMHGRMAFIRDWAAAVKAPPADNTAVICPPFPYLQAVRDALPAGFSFGAQTVAAHNDDGARTGEVSAAMLAECGCDFVIVGHSERRAMQHEDDALCAAKIQAAVAAGLRPILCVGESAQARDRNEATTTVLAQMENALPDANDKIFSALIIAYEPIWAIGSGISPAAEDINAIHFAIRRHLIEKTEQFGGKIPLLYGGSVNMTNAADFISIENVNGLLVGGASLQPHEFNAIYNLS